MKIKVAEIEAVLTTHYEIESKRETQAGGQNQFWRLKNNLNGRTHDELIDTSLFPDLHIVLFVKLRENLMIAGDPNATDFHEESRKLRDHFAQINRAAVEESTKKIIESAKSMRGQ